MDEKAGRYCLPLWNCLRRYCIKSHNRLFTTKGIAELVVGANIGAKWLLGITAVTAAIGIFAYNHSKAKGQAIEDTMKHKGAGERSCTNRKPYRKVRGINKKTDQTTEVKTRC